VAWLLFILAWVLIGVGTIFVAFSGGPRGAREAYLTKGRRAFTFIIVLLYIGIGITVPALVLANRQEAEGASPDLKQQEISGKLETGKTLFQQTCKSCHTLRAVDALGVTGPNLDEIGQVTKQRVLNAIKIGGTGQKRMPSGLLQGANADAVATYVSTVAGK
jgi:mono/diheme cytochrome c family protein